MSTTKVLLASILFGAAVAAQPALAATDAFSTTELNLRAGPSTRFPSVALIRAGDDVTVHGCISHYRWCDVSYGGERGWAYGAYLQKTFNDRPVYLPVYAHETRSIPVIKFNIHNYWDTYYHDENFYDELDHWDDYEWADDPLPTGWDDTWDEY